MLNDYLNKQKKLVKELKISYTLNNNAPTIIEIQPDYATDNQICLTLVTFIPPDITDKIYKNIIEPLKNIEPNHYYYPPESMHITIKNIRTIHWPPLFNGQDIKKADELFKKTIPQFPAFHFNIEDVILFPISLSVMAYSSDVLQKLIFALDAGLKQIGLPDNKKYLSSTVYWGNITLCRFISKPSKNFTNQVKKMRKLKIGQIKIKNIKLITCNAVCHPKTRKIIGEYQFK